MDSYRKFTLSKIFEPSMHKRYETNHWNPDSTLNSFVSVSIDKNIPNALTIISRR